MSASPLLRAEQLNLSFSHFFNDLSKKSGQ